MQISSEELKDKIIAMDNDYLNLNRTLHENLEELLSFIGDLENYEHDLQSKEPKK